ncbi:MAG: 50S ribosomal protein L20 [Acidobacteria bacterium]|nr:50S ribosomal protein L20 [Acidobacteriota bacterium]
MRVKRGPKRKNRRRKILKLASGYWGLKSRSHRLAKEQVARALDTAYTGRKDRKRDFRKMWIVRIGAASRLHGLSYSRFIAGLKAAGSDLDRKVLADIAVHDEAAFAVLVEQAKSALDGKKTASA